MPHFWTQVATDILAQKYFRKAGVPLRDDDGELLLDESGKVIGIIEKKDAAPEQLAIKEVNPSYFCFQAGWLWQNFEKIKNDNQQKEYYLTDLIKIARQQGEEIATVPIEPKEAAGVNTEEQLKLIEKLMK